MSSKAASPTATLIRHSRLMAMPAPRSAAALTESQIYRPPYPTHQAITAPESSRHRGDWGLKRPIPRKVASTYLRYNDIDTIEHRTTFQSSHDTVVSLKKWQEMGIPLKLFDQISGRFTSAFYFDAVPSVALSNPPPPPAASAAPAAADPAADQDQQPIATPKPAAVNPPIWGYREKFVQHMTPGELKTFIDTKLVPRRAEFQEFAKKWEPNQRSSTPTAAPPLEQTAPKDPSSEDAALAENAQPSASQSSDPQQQQQQQQQLSFPAFQPNFTVEPIPDVVKGMRHDPITSVNYVRAFLQIPLRQAPMTTHPSGGLYYILDPSYLENHPEHGPTGDRLIPARLIHKLDLKLADASWRRRSFYLVGGFVIYAAQDVINRINSERSSNITRTLNLTPISADMDQSGKIRIEFDHIAPQQLFVKLMEATGNRIRNQVESGRGDLAAVRAAGSPQQYQQEYSGTQSPLTDRSGRPPPGTIEYPNGLLGLLGQLIEAGRDDPSRDS
ncbi:hypothetical protein TWF696_001192 [Orbilia brochopaga]|uniref:Uncharacterized protein n=1 Tax=Orbilia brochopaga TaxID=3140254 RepID=A0AAV9UBJ2_9PEZI